MILFNNESSEFERSNSLINQDKKQSNSKLVYQDPEKVEAKS